MSDGIFVDIEEPAQKSHPLLKGGLWNRKVIQLDLCGLYEDCVKNILPGKGSRERMKKRIEAELGHCKISSCGSSLACVGGTARAV